MIRLVIADDQRLMREGLATIFELERDLQVVGLAANGIEAMEKVQKHQPDVVLMDIQMPVMNGVEGTKQILSQYPDQKILMLTTFNDQEWIISALENGAKGYLLKDMRSEAIIQAIHTVHQGGVVMQPDVTQQILDRLQGQHQQNPKAKQDQQLQRLSLLTTREKDVLRLLGMGYNNPEISAKLYISEGTVKNHISAILRKLEIRDRTQAALFALQAGMTDK